MDTITKQLNDIAERFCNDYCRYPREWNEKEEGMELSESSVCENCPINKI